MQLTEEAISTALHRVSTGMAGQPEAELLAAAILVWHPAHVPPPRREIVLAKIRTGDGLVVDVAYVDAAGEIRLIGGDPHAPLDVAEWARIPHGGEE